MMSGFNLALVFLVVLIVGVLLIVASGAMQIYLPAFTWKKWAVRFAGNLGSVSVVLNTVFVWGKMDTVKQYLPRVFVPIIAIAAPLLMIAAVAISLRYTIIWVHRHFPEANFPDLGNNMITEMIGKIKNI